MKKIILHIDMNSYFASVEQQANPFLRGKPVGVCAYLSRNGAIIASSIEAKQEGIKVGVRAGEALAIDPNVILVQNEPAKYRSTTRAIFSLLQEYANTLEPYSIDEAFLDLTHQVRTFGQARHIAQDIRQRIKDEIGEWLRCSIGISFTRWLAKFASDTTTPDSILVLEQSGLDHWYEQVKDLQAAWGINVALERRLNALGIQTLLELKRYPPANLLRVLGKWGYYLWAHLNGLELSGVSEPAPPKTIGHSYVLPKRTDDRSYHEKILMKLAERVGRRLRSRGLEAKGITLYLGYRDDGFQTRRRLDHPLHDGWEIFSVARSLLKQAPAGQVVTMLAVTVFSLQPVSGQQELLKRRREPRQLVSALDRINDKYGEFTITRGQMWGTEENANDRVGYRKTLPMSDLFKPPELEVEEE